MFAYLRGKLVQKTRENVIMDVCGVGYSIQIPYSTYQLLPDIDCDIKLYTYMAVREDNVSLFGFFSNEEKRIFEQVISVSGIGPKLAVGILSDITPADFSVAVITDDVNRLTKISGIGKKTAQRIIIELKDKMKSDEIKDAVETPILQGVVNDDVDEAISALQVLGYTNKDAVSMVNSVDREDMSVEEIIRLALKNK